MQKSQLRRLALDHAHGELQSDDYVRERGELIDAISAGRLEIKREPDPPPRRPPPEEQERTLTRKVEESPGASPAFIGVGIAVIALLAWVGWSLLAPAPPPSPNPVVSPVPAPATAPAAESLVTDFVADNNWNRSSTERFLASWRNLSDSERDEARSAPWFRSMTSALRQQVNAHHALAGLNGGGADREDGLRLVQFARDLGVTTKFPDFGAGEDQTATDTEDNSPGTTDSTGRVIADRQAIAPDPAARAPATESVTSIEGTPAAQAKESAIALAAANSEIKTSSANADTGPDWLAGSPAGRHALQLHAVTQLGKVRELVQRYPAVDLKIVETAGTGDAPTYRVMHGSYPSADAAKAAFGGLPEGLREGQSFALVKSLDALKGQGERGIVLPEAEDPYTLQLFAFGSRENANRLLSRFPQLGLRVHHSGASESRHRVLMGRFASVAAALTAAEKLPATLLQETAGPPVVKLARDPDGAAITR